MKTLEELVSNLIQKGSIKDQQIRDAFSRIDRADFVTVEYKKSAYEDIALPIGYGATISQPTTIAFMLEMLDARAGQKILEIGTGSGYVTALLAVLAGDRGIVYSIEYVPELVAQASVNLAPYNFRNIALYSGNGKEGLAAYAPYDRIISGAAGSDIPETWKWQLAGGGKIIAPVKSSIWMITKSDAGEFSFEEFPGFMFVPLK